jgi:predicted amidohydrolase
LPEGFIMSKHVINALAVLFATAFGALAHGAESSSDGAEGWRFVSARDEIAAEHRVERNDSPLLLLAGRGDRNVDGRWVKRVAVTGGRYYQFDAPYRAEHVETPPRNVLASVLWYDARGRQLQQAEFPLRRPAGKSDDGWSLLTGTYQAPAGAAEAQLELRLRWAPTGRVAFRPATLTETTAPGPRKVRIASVNHRPRGTKSPRDNLEQFARFVEEAASQKADIVCLPEGTTVCGTKFTYAEVAEPLPGPTTEFLGSLAARHHLYLVAGLYEREGTTVYNTSVLIGRDGKLVGKYRKVCLPREEIDAGITPGTEYPVFDTDFGRVGMMICWDVSYPEVARELSARGAEVIFMPIWGGNETLARARAIENQVYLVASGYDFRTAIYDKAGDELAKSPEASGVILREIDLNDRMLWPWLGDWRSRIWREGPARGD